MVIQCTKALIEKLKLKKSELIPIEKDRDAAQDFYAWHAHYFTINRRKVIVCMNNLTRYTVVLFRPKPKDMASFKERLAEGIRTAFREEGIREEVITAYLERCGNFEFSKTAGRSIVANMNTICDRVEWFADFLDEENVIQERISLVLGTTFMSYGGKYGFPNERLFCELCKMMDVPENDWDKILAVENYQLKIKINLKQYDIWRRVLVPSRCTFQVLHEVIQETFGWFHYHQHEFRIMDDASGMEEGLPLYAYPTKIQIVDGYGFVVEDYLEPDKYEVGYDTDIRLKDIFNRYDKCVYIYDFGDNWEHIITLEKVIKESTNRYPVLMERKGERPPEDVGGEAGFEEYMRVISDKDNPEYESMLQWSEMTRAREKTIEEINRCLKR